MKHNQEYKALQELEITIEAFDAFDGTHEFSQRYKADKKKMINRYRREVYWRVKGKAMKAAAAVLAILLAPGITYAANNDFFSRIWGREGKEDIQSHEEVLYDAEKDSSCIITYPQVEYADIDPDKAEELIGGVVSREPIVKEIGDVRLTILTSVCDGNAAVVEFMLEREGGIDGFCYSQLDNESKGAWFSEDAPFMLYFEGGERIFVDLDKSTKDRLYCYDYVVPESSAWTKKGLTMEIYYRPDEKSIEEEMRTESLFVPLDSRAERAEYVNEQGGSIYLSPISMTIDRNAGLGLSKEEAYDPWYIYYVSINFKDGTGYLVHEHEIEGIHSCETHVDNVGYSRGDEQNQFVIVFNRLVDFQNVASVTVNETVYRMR